MKVSVLGLKGKRPESFVGERANTAQITRLAFQSLLTMNSSTSRFAEKKQTQEEIKRQIALLQSCLEPEPETAPSVPKSPKRKAIESVTLAPATPSPSQYKHDICLDLPYAKYSTREETET